MKLLAVLAALLMVACASFPLVTGEGAALGLGAGAATGVGVASIATGGLAFIAAVLVGATVLFFSKSPPVEHNVPHDVPYVPILFWLVLGAVVLILFLSHHPRVRGTLSKLVRRKT